MRDPAPPRGAVPHDLALLNRTGDPLPAHVRAVVGRSVQLRLPMRDVVDLRRTAEILRGYANKLEAISRSRDPNSGALILQAWAEARITQARLQSAPGEGRKNNAG